MENAAQGKSSPSALEKFMSGAVPANKVAIGGRDEKEAQEAREESKPDEPKLEPAASPAAPRLPYAAAEKQLLRKFLKQLPKSTETMERLYDKVIREFRDGLGKCFDEVTEQDFREWVKRVKKGRRGGAVLHSTMLDQARHLGVFYEWLWEELRIAKPNPAAVLENEGLPGLKDSERLLKADDIVRMLVAVAGRTNLLLVRNRTMLLFIVALDLTTKEVVELTLNDLVELKDIWGLHIARRKVVLPLLPNVAAMLHNWLQASEPRRPKAEKELYASAMFYAREAEKTTSRVVSDVLRQAASCAGLPAKTSTAILRRSLHGIEKGKKAVRAALIDKAMYRWDAKEVQERGLFVEKNVVPLVKALVPQSAPVQTAPVQSADAPVAATDPKQVLIKRVLSNLSDLALSARERGAYELLDTLAKTIGELTRLLPPPAAGAQVVQDCPKLSETVQTCPGASESVQDG